MVKTTFEIKDEIYRKLVEASLKKYGNARSISKMANEVIAEHLKEPEIERVKHFTSKELQERRKAVEESFGIWKDMKETGAEYVRKLRDESEKRRKRLGL